MILKVEKENLIEMLVFFLVAHHAEELLRQGVVGEEVELGGVRCQSRVSGRRVVETGAQRQVFPQQLHVILYPL